LWKGGIVIYKYIFVEAQGVRMLASADHRELIDKYSKEGWKFITAIPTAFSGYGVIKKYDLVFEKED
jgi:hypothetical protein